MTHPIFSLFDFYNIARPSQYNSISATVELLELAIAKDHQPVCPSVRHTRDLRLCMVQSIQISFAPYITRKWCF